ncbi:hypothetical protein N2152v2_000941 [Parachlorella kessleri]
MLQKGFLAAPSRAGRLCLALARPGRWATSTVRRHRAAEGRQLAAAVTNIYQLERESVSATPSSARKLKDPEPFIAYEIVKGALVRYSDISEGKQPPTAVLVHGILGNRRNMQSFARRLVQGFPQWQVVLVDLRCHGDSAALSAQQQRPHSVESAAADITRLLAALKLFPEVLIGHSFGGKCVLSICQQFSRMAATRLPKPVRAWVLDALPGEVRSGEMGKADRPADLITSLRRTPLPLPSRAALISQLEEQGFSTGVAAWAATNLQPFQGDPGKLTWGFDLEGIHEMYRSYESTQLWEVLSRPLEGLTINFVKAERSTFRWGGGDEHRIRSLGHDVHLLPNSGHWVHTDNPVGLFNILAPSFGGQPDLSVQQASAPHSSGNILSFP